MPVSEPPCKLFGIDVDVNPPPLDILRVDSCDAELDPVMLSLIELDSVKLGPTVLSSLVLAPVVLPSLEICPDKLGSVDLGLKDVDSEDVCSVELGLEVLGFVEVIIPEADSLELAPIAVPPCKPLGAVIDVDPPLLDVLSVDPCEFEVFIPDSNPLELEPFAVPPCKLLDIDVDVNPPPLGVLRVDSCDVEASDPLELVLVAEPPCKLPGADVDVPVYGCASTLGVMLLVDPCDVEASNTEADPLELAPVDVLSPKMLGIEIDVCPPTLDVLPIAKTVVPILPMVVPWLDVMLRVVDDAPCSDPLLDPLLELDGPSCNPVFDVVVSIRDTADGEFADVDDADTALFEASLPTANVPGEETDTLPDVPGVDVWEVAVTDVVTWADVGRSLELIDVVSTRDTADGELADNDDFDTKLLEVSLSTADVLSEVETLPNVADIWEVTVADVAGWVEAGRSLELGDGSVSERLGIVRLEELPLLAVICWPLFKL